MAETMSRPMRPRETFQVFRKRLASRKREISTERPVRDVQGEKLRVDVRIPRAEGDPPGEKRMAKRSRKYPAPQRRAPRAARRVIWVWALRGPGERPFRGFGEDEGPVGGKGCEKGEEEDVQHPGMEKIPEGEAEDVKPCIIAEDRVGRSEGRAVEKSQNHGPLRGDGRSVRHAEEDRPPRMPRPTTREERRSVCSG
ncbi:hypothetical protein MASR2M17_08400 [Aminivibrio sp.]